MDPRVSWNARGASARDPRRPQVHDPRADPLRRVPPPPCGGRREGAPILSTITKTGAVETWWDVHGDGEPLVLLHPGGADSRAWDANLEGLAAHFRVFRFDRRGQGRTPDVGGPITFDAMAEDAVAFIETVVGGPVSVFGHSAGAPVALLIAQRRPDLLRAVVFSEGVYHFDGWKPGVLDPLPTEVLEYLAGLYGEVSPHGPDHWPSVWSRLDHEHHRAPTLTTEDLAAIATPTLLMFADNGGEVRFEHLHAMHRALPNSQLAVVPGTGHGLPAEKPELCNRMIVDFIDEATSRRDPRAAAFRPA